MSTPRARLVLLVGHDAPTRTRLAVRARLLGLDPRPCLTAEGALEAAAEARPLAVISDLVLPGVDGLVGLARIEARWPGVNTVLLSPIPPGPSQPDRARHAVDHILARRGDWEPAVVQAAFPGLAPAKAASALWRALDAGGEAVAALVAEGGLDGAIEALALEHLSATRPPEEVLPALEAAIRRPEAEGRDARFETALELAMGQGAAGLEVAAQVSGASAAPEPIRARALRWIAERFPLHVSMPILTPLAQAGEGLWLDAAEALLEAAEAAGREGQDILRVLAEGETVPARVRARAAEALAHRHPRAEVGDVLRRLAADPDPGMRDLVARLFAQGDDLEAEDLAARAADPRARPEDRRAALEAAAHRLPLEAAQAVLRAAQRAEAPALRALAFELEAARFEPRGEDPEAERPTDERRARPSGSGAAGVREAAAPESSGGMSSAAGGTPAPAARGAEMADPGHAGGGTSPAAARRPTTASRGAEMAAPAAEAEDLVARAVSSGPQEAQAVLLGAMKAGRRAFALLRALARDPRVFVGTRRKALRLLALRFEPARVVPVLAEALAASEPELVEAARLAAVQLGRPGQGLLYSTLSSKAAPFVRAGALESLERHAPADFVQLGLRRGSRDPDFEVREVAVRLAARRAGAEITPLVEAITKAGQGALFSAAVEGAASLGLCGFVGLARLALADAVPLPARRQAWAHLEAGFDGESLAPVRARLEARAKDVLTPPASSEARGEAAPAPRDEPAPARPAVPRSVPRGPAVSSWEVADTAPMAPADADAGPPATPAVPQAETETEVGPPPVAASEAATRPMAPADLPTQPTPPADTRPEPPAGPTAPAKPAIPAEAKTLVDRPWGEAIPRGTSSFGRPPTAAPRAPSAAPEPPRPPSPPPRAPAVDEPDATILPSGPAAPRPRPKIARDRKISLPRARKALQTALQLGQDGFRGVKTLADSSRVPAEVRVQALRHLAGSFSDRPVTSIFERALDSDDPAIQNTALSCVMLQREVGLAPVARLVARPDAEVATRVRALRFISSRYPKRKTRELFEALLESDSPTVRKTALESLFTSMRFVPPERVEAGLVNILKEHDDPEVRVSAAKALGAFGTEASEAALRSAAGLFATGPLAEAAKHALERIRERK